jgi:hypothetical protein
MVKLRKSTAVSDSEMADGSYPATAAGGTEYEPNEADISMDVRYLFPPTYSLIYNGCVWFWKGMPMLMSAVFDIGCG